MDGLTVLLIEFLQLGKPRCRMSRWPRAAWPKAKQAIPRWKVPWLVEFKKPPDSRFTRKRCTVLVGSAESLATCVAVRPLSALANRFRGFRPRCRAVMLYVRFGFFVMLPVSCCSEMKVR